MMPLKIALLRKFYWLSTAAQAQARMWMRLQLLLLLLVLRFRVLPCVSQQRQLRIQIASSLQRKFCTPTRSSVAVAALFGGCMQPEH